MRPRLLCCHADGDPVSTGFLERRGFTPGRRLIISSLDLGRAALRPPEPPGGIRIAPLRELRDRPADLFALYLRTEEDIPADVQYGQLTIDEWIPETLEHPDLDWDASVAALEGEELVALAFLSTAPERRVATNEMTGTLPDFRGRGLARLVKLDSLRRAAATGIQRVIAANDAENAPILAVNASLGYRQAKVLTNYELALSP